MRILKHLELNVMSASPASAPYEYILGMGAKSDHQKKNILVV